MLFKERAEEFEADLEDLFDLRRSERGRHYASLRYMFDVLTICTRRSFRKKRSTDFYQHQFAPIMFKNYLIIAFRSLRRHKLYSGINILGLAGGLAVCMLIFLFVRDEMSYDRFFSDSDRIHRLTSVFATQQVTSPEARLTYRAADLMEDDFPEIEDAVRLIRIADAPLFSYGENRFYEDQFYFADSTFFEVFNLPYYATFPGIPISLLTWWHLRGPWAPYSEMGWLKTWTTGAGPVHSRI